MSLFVAQSSSLLQILCISTTECCEKASYCAWCPGPFPSAPQFPIHPSLVTAALPPRGRSVADFPPPLNSHPRRFSAHSFGAPRLSYLPAVQFTVLALTLPWSFPSLSFIAFFLSFSSPGKVSSVAPPFRLHSFVASVLLSLLSVLAVAFAAACFLCCIPP